MKINTGHRVDKREHGTTPGVQSDGELVLQREREGQEKLETES